MPEALKKTTRAMVAFGDVVQLSKERSQDPEADGFERYIGLEHLKPSDLKVRSWGDISDGVTFTSVFRPGQVLFGKRRAYQRKVAVADFSGVCSGDIYVLESKGDQLLPELLPFICQSEPFYDYVISMSQGGLSPRVNWKALAKYEFALPPLEEQRRIVKVLQASRLYIEQLAELNGLLEKAYQSTIDGLVEQSISDSHEHRRFGTAPHQTTIALNDASQITDCKHRTPELVDVGVPMVAPGDIRWGAIELQSCKRIADTEYPSFMDHVAVKGGDLVLSRNQTFGIASYVTTDSRFALGQDTVLVQPALYTSSYIYLMLRSTFVQRQILRYAAGSTFGRINLGDIRRLRIPKVDSQALESAHSIWTKFESSLRVASERVSSAVEQSATLVNQLIPGGALTE